VEPICLQGRTLSGDDLALVRGLIAQHPHWHRTALSLHLCELWGWRNGAGRLKDMAARTLLLKLQARGLIELPPPQRRTARPCARSPASFQPELLPPTATPIDSCLGSVQPLRLELAADLRSRRHVGGLLARYHYRGFNGAVGENLQYLARDQHGRELAVMVFGAAAWKVAARDQFIGWSVPQRQQHLGLIANQQRFLILPWVRVPHLASHLLGWRPVVCRQTGKPATAIPYGWWKPSWRWTALRAPPIKPPAGFTSDRPPDAPVKTASERSKAPANRCGCAPCTRLFVNA
jgi:hypothetical protein